MRASALITAIFCTKCCNFGTRPTSTFLKTGSNYGKEIVAVDRVTSSLVVFCIAFGLLEVSFD
jgi:hypothetical protein